MSDEGTVDNKDKILNDGELSVDTSSSLKKSSSGESLTDESTDESNDKSNDVSSQIEEIQEMDSISPVLSRDTEKTNDQKTADEDAYETQKESSSESNDDKSGIVASLGDIFGKILHKGESGFKKATDMTVPKELISYGKEQIGSFRKDMVGIVGTEVKSFLGNINVTQEVLKIFTLLTFEIKMQIRLVPSEKGGLVLKPKAEVSVIDKSKFEEEEPEQE